MLFTNQLLSYINFVLYFLGIFFFSYEKFNINTKITKTES